MEKLNALLKKITKIDHKLAKKTQARLDSLTKPQGSLGRLEELAKQIVEITGLDSPPTKNKVIFTIAGDHGITEEGVSAFPKEVTPQMVYNFLNGGAGVSVLAKHIGARVIVTDMGIAKDLENIDTKKGHFRNRKIDYGTKNFTKGPAMTKEQAVRSIVSGIELFEEEMANGIDIAGTGDMGIGNTTPSSAIAAVITGKAIKDVTGRGTGIGDSALLKKQEVIKKGLDVNKPDPKDAIDVLAKVGGFEIGGLAGVILGASLNRIPIIIDGFISGAAALIAYTLEPKAKEYIIAAHSSVEKGHKAILDHLGANPLLDLELRLGEGTGTALVMPIVEASVKILNEMATFGNASVSERTDN